jgi:hypothetical protein
VNYFGVVLKPGTVGVFKQARFYNTKASVLERTFTITGGLGRDPKNFGSKVTGTWPDGTVDTIDVYSLEWVVVGGKKLMQVITGDPPPDPTPIVEAPEPEESKPVRRKRG